MPTIIEALKNKSTVESGLFIDIIAGIKTGGIFDSVTADFTTISVDDFASEELTGNIDMVLKGDLDGNS